jgi:hypothetical protein
LGFQLASSVGIRRNSVAMIAIPAFQCGDALAHEVPGISGEPEVANRRRARARHIKINEAGDRRAGAHAEGISHGEEAAPNFRAATQRIDLQFAGAQRRGRKQG